MSSYGVSDISAGAGEGVCGMLNGTDLTLRSIARLGAYEGGRSVGVDTFIKNEMVEVGGFSEDDRERFGKEILG